MLPSGVASVHSAQRVSCSEKLKFTFELPYEAQGHTKTMKRGKLLKTTFIRSTLGRWSNIIFVFFSFHLQASDQPNLAEKSGFSPVGKT